MATQGVTTWSKIASSNANAEANVNWAEGQAPSTVNDSARWMMASVAKWRDDLYGLTTGGTNTAYTVTTNSTYASASDMSGAVFTIIPNATSGASPTLAVDGLTARAINLSTGAAIPTGYLVSGTPYLVKYVHATTEFIVLGESGKNTLAALDIITGTSSSTIATSDTLPLYSAASTANRRMLVSDFLKVVNALTEDTSPDSAADFTLTYDNSATAAKKVKLSNLPTALPRGYIDGCILSNNGTDATNDIDIAAGKCRDSTDTVDIIVPAITGKQLDANWAAGGSAGMRNSAAGIANTTYHIYAVRTAASSTADIYAHTSATVSTVLTALQAETGGSSYIYARRIGSITRVSNALVAFIQDGDDFRFAAMKQDVSNASPGTSANTGTLTVPTGIKVKARGTGYCDGNLSKVLVSSLAESDDTPGQGLGQQYFDGGATGRGNFTWEVWTNTSAQVRYRTTVTGQIYLYTRGWLDQRGKDA